LIRVAQASKILRHGDSGLETAELPTKSPVITALLQHAFPGGEMIPNTRFTCTMRNRRSCRLRCPESWVAYLARCARQRRCQRASPIAAGRFHSLFVDVAGRLLACGDGAAVGHGDADTRYLEPAPVAALAGVRVRSVAAGTHHSLALSWDGRVFSWGCNRCGRLGHGDELDRHSPVPIEGIQGIDVVAAAAGHSLAVTQSGDVFSWGGAVHSAARNELRPVIVEGFEGVRVRRACAEMRAAFAIGEAGELFSWGVGEYGRLGHGDTQDKPSPKRVEALQGFRMSSVSSGRTHALALTEDGQVYAWGWNHARAVLGSPRVEVELLPKPVEALRGVRVGSIAAAAYCSYAVADTGEVWAWGCEGLLTTLTTPLGHNSGKNCPIPKPIRSLQGTRVDAVAAASEHTLAWADDGSVCAWGSADAAWFGSLGLGAEASYAYVRTPQRISALRVACGV
jgi:alpha-tubulin suppressor-like RCC1 family protein